MANDVPIYGLVVEFDDAGKLVDAAREVHQEGYTRMDAYSPFPIEELDEAMDAPRTRLPYLVLIGGICGCLGGFAMQYYAAVISYPLNVGGRPLNSWPAFIPVTFELTILASALTAVLGMLALNGLPQPYHPLFHLEEFSRASQDRFFLCIEARDPKFDRERTGELLKRLADKEPLEVPR